MDAVEIAVHVPAIGETSIPTEYEIRVEGVSGERDGSAEESNHAVAATGETIQVVSDVEANRPQAVPDGWREAIAAFEHG